MICMSWRCSGSDGWMGGWGSFLWEEKKDRDLAGSYIWVGLEILLFAARTFARREKIGVEEEGGGCFTWWSLIILCE